MCMAINTQIDDRFKTFSFSILGKHMYLVEFSTLINNKNS